MAVRTIKVTLEFYGDWMATARDEEGGELAMARCRSKESAQTHVVRKLLPVVDEPFEVEWLDLTDSLKEED